jgi:hypothetical protein
MHQAILQEAEKQELPLPVKSVRFIANAAGLFIDFTNYSLTLYNV